MIEDYKDIYKVIVQNSAIGITMADEHERIISWNKFMESLLGMEKSDLEHKEVRSFYSDEEWKRIRSLNIRKKGMHHQMETKVIKKDGSLIDVDLSISVLKNESGQVTGSIGIMRDITERKQAEKAMLEADTIKKDFLSMVSHELSTPLMVLEESVNILVDEIADRVNAEQKDFLFTAQRNVERLKRLISDILDYQRISASDTGFNNHSWRSSP